MAVLLPKFKTVQKQVDDVNRVTRENLTGLKVVRAFNAEKYQEDKFESVNENLMKTQMFTMRGMALLFPVMIFVQSALSLGIYWLGAKLVDDHDRDRTVILYPENARFAWGDFRISEICDDLLHVSGGRCDRRGHVFYMEISGTDPGGRSALLAFHANI